VYSKKPTIILDDIFSGQDAMTEEHISRDLFGKNGILRRGAQTVVLATHTVHLLSQADMVIVLGENSKVVYQGTSTNLPRELIPKRDHCCSAELASPSKYDTVGTVERSHDESFVPILHPLTQENDVAAQEVSRQMGDFQVYKYYLNTMGLKHAILFAVLGAICMGFTPAQSEQSYI